MLTLTLTLLSLILLSSPTFAAKYVIAAASSNEDVSRTGVKYALAANFTGWVAIGLQNRVVRSKNTGQGSYSLLPALDSRKIALSTPGPNNAGELGFYYGVLDELWTWNINAAQPSIDGVYAELGARFQSIFVYYNRDSVPGFGWTAINSDVFDCSRNETYDCVDSQGVLRFKEDLQWGNLAALPDKNCPIGNKNTVPYTADCRIRTAEVSAFVKGTNIHVVTVTLYVANQPIILNGNLLPVGHAKIDVDITYPWDTANLTGSAAGDEPKIGMTVVVAGKVTLGQFTGQAVVVNGQNGYKWGSSAYSTSWTAKGNATVDGEESQVYTGSFNGPDIIAYVGCTGNLTLDCTISAQLCFICSLRNYAKGFDTFLWTPRVLWYTWDDDEPAQIYWDPTMALEAPIPDPEPEPESEPNSSPRFLVSLLMSVIVLVAFLFI